MIKFFVTCYTSINLYYIILLLPLIECLPTDSDECLANSPNWDAGRDCAYAKSYCTSWAKDARRCCPETCGTGLLTESECNSLDSKGTCIYPLKNNQCPKGGIRYKIIYQLITLIDSIKGH